MEHTHNAVANTDEVFSTFIGCRVKGMLHAEVGEIIILVFSCGWGLAFNSNGAHWTENPEDVQKIILHSRKALYNARQELERLLELAGESIED